MPFTPYHFGPAGFIGLLFKKRIDIPAFLLANVAIDIEPLIIMLRHLGWPHHRFCHTFIGATAVAIALAAFLYPLRNLLKKIMHLFRLPYEPTYLKILIWSILGAWFHIFIDSLTHWDMKPFWPSKARPLLHLIAYNDIINLCLAFWLAAIILLLINFIIVRLNECKQNQAGKNG